MKLMNVQTVKGRDSVSFLVKMFPLICLFFCAGIGMLNIQRSKANTHNRTEESVFAADKAEYMESAHAYVNDAYVLAGKNEPGIIIIGGGIMFMSNRKLQFKIRKKKD